MAEPTKGEPVDLMMVNIGLVRRDISNLWFHFTKKVGGLSAGEVLCKILEEQKLRGSLESTVDRSNCICFTEAPITELAAVFHLAKIASPQQRPVYEPWGVAVTKEWLFEKGGRPVVYQPESECELLSAELRWRHVGYDPGELNKDTAWEREWRVQTDELALEVTKTLVIVPDASSAQRMNVAFNDEHPGLPWPLWMVVSLDLLGVPEAYYG